MARGNRYTVALLWAGDAEERRTASLEKNRLAATAAALDAVGIATEPAVYGDAFADEVLEQLLRFDGVLVWVNPIIGPGDRKVLDGLLRKVADTSVFVSAHPDAILAMGTKEVLFRARHMGWGCDTRVLCEVNVSSVYPFPDDALSPMATDVRARLDAR